MSSDFRKGFDTVLGVFAGLCACSLILKVAEKLTGEKSEKKPETKED